MVFLAFAEGGSIQLVPDGTIFIHIALILLMIYILNRTFFRPINRILETRERKGGAGGEARGILEQVDKKTSEYNAAMREARTEGYGLIESERSAAVAERESKIEAVKAEAAEKLAAENESLQSQTATAKAALQTEAQSIADKISSSILKA